MDSDAFRRGTLTQQVKGWLIVDCSYLRPWSFICGSIAVFRFSTTKSVPT